MTRISSAQPILHVAIAQVATYKIYLAHEVSRAGMQRRFKPPEKLIKIANTQTKYHFPAVIYVRS